MSAGFDAVYTRLDDLKDEVDARFDNIEVPVAVVRGLEQSWFRTGSVADAIVRSPADDLFR